MRGAKAAKIAFWLGLGSTALAALAAYGTGWGLWHFIPGLLGVVAAVLLALIAAAATEAPGAKWLGLVAVALASVNIFGGFAVTERMLAMYKKKEKKG